MKFTNFARTVCLAAFIAPACLQASIIINNASFETPVQGAGGFTYNPTGVGIGWTFIGGAGIASNGSPWYVGAAPDGTQAAFLQVAPSATPGAFSQSLALTVGDIYQITFLAAERNLSLPPDTFAVSLGGSGIGSFSPATTSFVLNTTSTIVATAASEVLLFQSTSPSTADRDSAIDNVIITDLGPAVPEPGTFFLLIPALGGLTVLARRRSKA
jgi:hypothetical protein